MKPLTLCSHTLWICSLKQLHSYFPYTSWSNLRVPLQRTRKGFPSWENLTLEYDFFLTSEARHIWTYPAFSPKEPVPKLQDQACISTHFDPLCHWKGTDFIYSTCSLLTSLLRLTGFAWTLNREGIRKSLTQLGPIPGWPQSYNWTCPRHTPQTLLVLQVTNWSHLLAKRVCPQTQFLFSPKVSDSHWLSPMGSAGQGSAFAV